VSKADTMVKADLTRDYYGDLDLAPAADTADIKKQFKKLGMADPTLRTLDDKTANVEVVALAYHPDRNPGRENEVTAKFQKIQSAHEVLIDPTERAKYDANRIRVSSNAFRNSYAGPSGMRGNPWSNVSAQYPTPPKPPTATRKPPPPSSGAERYRKNFATPQASAYQAAQEGPEARKSTYAAWENLRHNPKTNHGPGNTWKSPQPPPRGTPTSGRDESNARTQRPVPPRPQPQGFDEFRQSSSGHQRSHSSSAANRKGFMPNTPGGDEPPAPRGNYFTQRDKPSVAPDLPAREPPPSMDNAGPDPLRQFREKAMPTMEPRLSTPYATHGGEKFNPFESANINRSKSTRERNETYDPKSTSSPSKSDPNLKAPHRSRSFAEQRSTPRQTRATYTASVDLDSSSSDEVPQTNGSRNQSSAQRNNGTTSNAQPRPQPAPNASGQASTSKPSRVSLFRQWMKENPNTEPPPNGFPPDGPPLRSGQAKTDANGNPSMYETSPFCNQSSFNFEPKASVYEVRLPTVAETISSRPPYSTSKTEPARSASMKFPNPLFQEDRPATPPSGVVTDPEKLNTFEALQRTVIDGLLSNKRASCSGQNPPAAPTGLSSSQWSNQGLPSNGSNLRRSSQPGDFHIYRDSAEAGSPSKKFKPLKHLHSSHTYDFVKSETFWVEHDKRKRSANHTRQSSRFSFDFPNDTFTATRPPKNSFSSSAENISMKFTPGDWEGKFEAGGDYFRPEQKASGMPGRGRTQSGSRSRGRSPVKVRTGPENIPYMAPPTEPTPTESPGEAKFSPSEWAQTFKSQTFAPPPAGPVPFRAVPSRKRTGPTLRTTMGGNAAVVDDGSSSEEKPLFTGRKPTASPITVSPDPMDVDTPPVTNTVPQFTAAKINEKLSEPLKRPAASWSSSPIDTESLKVGFDDLKIRDLISSLNMPSSPKAPSPPTPSELGGTSRVAYENYVKRYAAYMQEWDIFNSKFLLHMVARKNQCDNAGDKLWTDERSTELYRLGLKEDQAVSQRWMEARAAHEGAVREFCIVRERMKGQVGRNGGGGASLSGNGKAPDREQTMRPSPRKKTH
jgi:curved DNA-binding protein CbpA